MVEYLLLLFEEENPSKGNSIMVYHCPCGEDVSDHSRLFNLSDKSIARPRSRNLKAAKFGLHMKFMFFNSLSC